MKKMLSKTVSLLVVLAIFSLCIPSLIRYNTASAVTDAGTYMTAVAGGAFRSSVYAVAKNVDEVSDPGNTEPFTNVINDIYDGYGNHIIHYGATSFKTVKIYVDPSDTSKTNLKQYDFQIGLGTTNQHMIYSKTGFLRYGFRLFEYHNNSVIPFGSAVNSVTKKSTTNIPRTYSLSDGQFIAPTDTGDNTLYKLGQMPDFSPTNGAIVGGNFNTDTLIGKEVNYNPGTYLWKLNGPILNDGETVYIAFGGFCSVQSGAGQSRTMTSTMNLTIVGRCKHSQGYTVQNATGENAATPATCTAKPTYYKTCAYCGKKGTETFSAGSSLGHLNDGHADNGADDDIHYITCSRCVNPTGTEGCTFVNGVCTKCGRDITYNVDFNGNNSTSGSMSRQTLRYNTASSLTSNAFARSGSEFICWNTSNNGTGTDYQNAQSVSKLTTNNKSTLNMYAQWADTKDIAVDFGKSMSFLQGDTVAYSETKPAAVSSADTSESFTANGVTVSGSGVSLGIGAGTESVYALENKTNGSASSKEWHKLNITPASNVLFEETALTYASSSDTKPDWTEEGTAGEALVKDPDAVYGFNEGYTDSTSGEFSDKTVSSITVGADAPTGEKASFSFTGEGFDFISACGNNTGCFTVQIKKGGASVKTFIVDTYLRDTSVMTDGSLLKQTPICQFTGDYGSYTVEITPVYLKSGGAVKNASSNGAATCTGKTHSQITAKSDVIAQLDEMGIIIDDPAETELVWFDDSSVLNGGAGNTVSDTAASNGGAASNGDGASSGVTEVSCYIDGVRIYKPLANESDYIGAEQDFNYKNIREAVVGNENTIGFYEKVSGNVETTSYDPYPLNEIFISDETLSFDVASLGELSEVYVGLRAVLGTPEVQIGAGSEEDGTAEKFEVISGTEMYYKVPLTAIASENGTKTVTVQVLDGSGMLAVNTIKYKNAEITPQSNGSLRSARFLMTAAPVKTVNPNVEPEAQPVVIPEELPSEIIPEPVVIEPVYFEMEADGIEEDVFEETTNSPECTENDGENGAENRTEEKSGGFFDTIVKIIKKIVSFFAKLFG